VIQDEWMLAKFEASSTAEGVVALLEDTIGAFQKDITRAKLSIASILRISLRHELTLDQRSPDRSAAFCLLPSIKFV
jgi:hypothetical protein